MDELIFLSDETLTQLPSGVRGPRYDRADLSAGIVHIGLGNFHRAHQAWYLHRLFDAGLCHDWAIVGAGVRPGDAAQREKLLAQDCLTTLIELAPEEVSAEVTGAMIDFVAVRDDNAPLVARMADPAIRIVALTVTEGGYYLGPDGSFDSDHADIRHDAEHPDRPRTAFGAMVAALRLRRERGHGPFAGLSCDNLHGNGAILRQTVVGLARLSDPDLGDWIESTCTFPNSMVDCIVPATGENEMALVRSLGIADRAPVTHEPYRQWVIEDNFCAGRPDWNEAGAVFSSRVHDYEALKLRILNAGHQILANAGELLSIGTISECMTHPLVSAMFERVQRHEIVPHVPSLPDMAAGDYVDLVGRRFSNPRIVDTTRRVAFDGSSRHPGFVLPSLRDGLDQDAPIGGLALVEALWARMCAGRREDGTEIEPNDPNWGTLNAAASAARERPAAWLEQRKIYGDLGSNDRFAAAFDDALRRIWADGTEAAIEHFLADDATQGDGRSG